MEEIPNNRLGCIKPCKKCNIYHINWWSPDFLEPSTVVWVFTSAKQFGRFSMSTGATDFWSINSFTSNIWWLYLLATRWTNFRGSSFTLIAENLPFAKWIYDLWLPLEGNSFPCDHRGCCPRWKFTTQIELHKAMLRTERRWAKESRERNSERRVTKTVETRP